MTCTNKKNKQHNAERKENSIVKLMCAWMMDAYAWKFDFYN
jgi:hypothetical protein